ncbi:hypothetical protein M3Y94_00992600 [Aphelenchoides besseyi]|nr:hypothetical protein M3Y94_00992600 [Aphelenchoides besseyi]
MENDDASLKDQHDFPMSHVSDEPPKQQQADLKSMYNEKLKEMSDFYKAQVRDFEKKYQEGTDQLYNVRAELRVTEIQRDEARKQCQELEKQIQSQESHSKAPDVRCIRPVVDFKTKDAFEESQKYANLMAERKELLKQCNEAVVTHQRDAELENRDKMIKELKESFSVLRKQFTLLTGAVRSDVFQMRKLLNSYSDSMETVFSGLDDHLVLLEANFFNIISDVCEETGTNPQQPE